MASLDSDKVDAALENKLGCEVDRTHADHNIYYVRENEVFLARTKISKGPKHTLSDTLVMLMARQLQVGGSGNLAKLVRCTMDKNECLDIIRAATRTKPAAAAKAEQNPPAKPFLGAKKKPR